jgi:hypothetical protein
VDKARDSIQTREVLLVAAKQKRPDEFLRQNQQIQQNLFCMLKEY